MASSSDNSNIESQTGSLFGDLWKAFDGGLYQKSIDLFEMRCKANGFDTAYFKGRKVLDAGCGGGRNSVAMAALGASVTGIDISDSGIEDARNRLPEGLDVTYRIGSVLDISFDDESFDFVWCSGVLHHTTDFSAGLDEVTRVLRPGGKLFLLIYGPGGLQWEVTDVCRPSCALMGYDFVDRAVQHSGLPANKRKAFLDCLFVPLVGYFSRIELELMLRSRGMDRVESWTEGKFDHEENVEEMLDHLIIHQSIFDAAVDLAKAEDPEKLSLSELCQTASVERVRRGEFLIQERAAGRLAPKDCYRLMIGHGNNRLMATKKG